MNTLKYFLPLLLVAVVVVQGGPPEDLVVSLPGLEFPVTFDQYSGYLNGTDGRFLHYWLTESKSNAATDPLVLWLNGGPGCSSLMGLLTELGPFRVATDGSGSLVPNIYAWNEAANVLFLESPACVGFSYDVNNNCQTGDVEVADMNYLALQHFFQKFQEYSGRDFYITGESYAGIYVPTLAVKVVEGQATFPINFRGYAVGNGLLSYNNNDNSLIFFGYYHALLGQTLWDNLVTDCCEGGIESPELCDFSDQVTAQCEVHVLAAFNIIYNSGLNVYNLYGDCLISGGVRRNEYSSAVENLFMKYAGKFNRPETYSDPPCTDNSRERSYLNTPEVRAALHIPVEVQDWDVCSDPVGNLYIREYDTTTPQLAFLQSNNITGLIYNGDVDMACNFLGNEWDIGTLGLTPLDNRVKWVVAGQVAGYVQEYPFLDFVTVLGSGHMVPTDKPEAALHMITSFLNDEPIQGK